MTTSVGIVGAGLLGRCLAVDLSDRGYQVALFDKDERKGTLSCGWAGAGMLTPYAELDGSDELVFNLGRDSTSLWDEFLPKLSRPVFLQQNGSLVVAHQRDRADLQRFRQRVESMLPASEPDDAIQIVGLEQLSVLESELAGRFSSAIYFPLEGQIDNRQLLLSLEHAIADRGIRWLERTEAVLVEPKIIDIIEPSSGESKREYFDWVIDCRGLGARSNISKLRGVRGEIVTLYAPDVRLERPVRMMHPRYSIYVVPRQDQQFLVGATSIESEDFSEITVQSTLELLSAAFSLHPGFALANVTEHRVNCRPALPDNHPHFYHAPGLLRINGLYRHGFLLTPKLVNLASQTISSGRVSPEFSSLFSEETLTSASAR